MSDFETELKIGFLDEASQLLSDAENQFLQLESNPEDPAITDHLFRLAHNFKGSGKAVGFEDLSAFTHALESLLLKVKNKELKIERPVVDLLLKCNDHLKTWIDVLRGDLSARIDSTGLLEQMRAYIAGQVPQTAAPVAETAGPAEQPEQHAAEPAFAQDSSLPFEAQAAPKARKPAANNAAATDETIRVSLARLEKLLNFVGEIVILQSVIKEQSQPDTLIALRKSIHQLGKVTREVQDISLSLRMVPLKQTFQKMQRIVRDTSAALNKSVAIMLEGEETEVDKTVLESLSDPLVHLIRNAVDHGIESAEARVAAGKSEAGTVTLKAYHQSGSLVIEVRDDGGGLNAEKLRAKAIEKGILRPDNKLTEKECQALIFAPGFSTKQEVTDVSGRGVGMDVVKTNIEALQGNIQIESQIGTGTTFKLTLPLTLAIIDGMIVRTAEERFIIPLSHVHETVRPTPEDLHATTGMGTVFTLRGENLPLYRLSGLLGSRGKEKPATDCVAIVVHTREQNFAVLVDEIVGQAQVVIKQIDAPNRDLRGFTGSAILGDGRPALILELSELRTRNGANALIRPQTVSTEPQRRSS